MFFLSLSLFPSLLFFFVDAVAVRCGDIWNSLSLSLSYLLTEEVVVEEETAQFSYFFFHPTAKFPNLLVHTHPHPKYYIEENFFFLVKAKFCLLRLLN